MSIGHSRNLTQQFTRLRTEARKAQPGGHEDSRHSLATARLLGAALDGPSSSSDVEMATTSAHAPSWMHIAESVRVEMGTLKERLRRLKEYHGRALLVTFDTEDETQQHMDALTVEVQRVFKRLDRAIRSMEAGGNAKGEDPSVRLQVQRQLANALFKMSVEFRKEETRFLNKVESQKGLEQGSSIGLIETDTGGTSEMLDPGFTSQQLAIVDRSSSLAEERDEEIRKIVETIADLAQIMRDLSTLVVEQGTVLDRVDYNIQEVAAKVESGVRQLQAAERSQKMGRMLMCIVGLITAIVVLLLIVVAKAMI